MKIKEIMKQKGGRVMCPPDERKKKKKMKRKTKTYKTIESLQNKNFGEVYTEEYGVLGIHELDRYYRNDERRKFQLVFEQYERRPSLKVKGK